MRNVFRLGRSSARDTAGLYAAIVAQSRHPHFYAAWGVPDTVAGRLEMVMLHLYLAATFIDRAHPDGKAAADELMDQFVADMDSALRELGVGDLSVGKKMRKVAELYAGHALAFRGALSSPDRVTALAEVIARNVDPEKQAPALDARSIAQYTDEADRRLAGLSWQDVRRAGLGSLFPAPAEASP
ncbi:MAG: ubiquinol-cytochrome C chaperone family protein [Hyphomicrobiales bacterium]